MFTVVSRAVIIYFVVVFLYRLMGKRQLGQMQPFELVLTLIIADLATIPMAEVSVPVLHGIVPLFTLVILHFVLTFLCKISNKFSSFLSGKPVIVINPNGIDYRALKNLSLSIDDLFEAIRGSGYFSLDQIQYAIMETNGKLSVMPKSQFSPVTIQDLKLQIEENVIPVNIINEGKLVKENLTIAEIDEKYVHEILQKLGIKKVNEVLVMTLDKNGQIFYQKFGEKSDTMQLFTEEKK